MALNCPWNVRYGKVQMGSLYTGDAKNPVKGLEIFVVPMFILIRNPKGLQWKPEGSVLWIWKVCARSARWHLNKGEDWPSSKKEKWAFLFFFSIQATNMLVTVVQTYDGSSVLSKSLQPHQELHLCDLAGCFLLKVTQLTITPATCRCLIPAWWMNILGTVWNLVHSMPTFIRLNIQERGGR